MGSLPEVQQLSFVVKAPAELVPRITEFASAIGAKQGEPGGSRFFKAPLVSNLAHDHLFDDCLPIAVSDCRHCSSV